MVKGGNVSHLGGRIVVRILTSVLHCQESAREIRRFVRITMEVTDANAEIDFRKMTSQENANV